MSTRALSLLPLRSVKVSSIRPVEEKTEQRESLSKGCSASVKSEEVFVAKLVVVEGEGKLVVF